MSGTMRCDVHTPGPPLAGLVAYLWSLSDCPGHARERIVASGTQELVINLCEDEFRIYDATGLGEARRFSGAMVSGAYGGSFAFDTRAHASIVGVHFEPGGAFPFLGLPLGELADRHVELETLWGPPARALRERLCAAPTARQRFGILEHALRARLARPSRRHPAVPLALARLRGRASVGEVASEAGLSQRRLIEVFKAEVGMTPKLFARVQRFQRARALAQRATAPDWPQLALACGYFDQAHLIRDCTAFAGGPPGALQRSLGPPVKENHIAL
jgi:AraC-like DNA-binding protein